MCETEECGVMEGKTESEEEDLRFEEKFETSRSQIEDFFLYHALQA